MLASRLTGAVDDPFAEAIRLSAQGTARTVIPTVSGIVRAWGPVLFLSLFVRHLGRFRLGVAGALAVAATRDWKSRPTELDRFRYVATRVADDLAYGTGLWWGCWRAKTLSPLLPVVTGRPAAARRPMVMLRRGAQRRSPTGGP